MDSVLLWLRIENLQTLCSYVNLTCPQQQSIFFFRSSTDIFMSIVTLIVTGQLLSYATAYMGDYYGHLYFGVYLVIIDESSACF